MKKDTSQNKVYQFLISYLKPFKKELILSLTAIIIVAFIILSLGIVLRSFINQGFIESNNFQLVNYFIVMFCLSIVLAIASYFRSRNINLICQKVENNIRTDIYQKLLQLPASYFEFNKVSDLMGRINNDLNLFSNSIILTSAFALRNLIMSVGGIALLLFNSLSLSLIVIATIPILFIPLKFFGNKIKEISRINQCKSAQINNHIEESLFYIKAIHAFNSQEQSFKKFILLNNDFDQSNFQRIKLRSLMFALIIALVLMAVSFVIWFGGLQVIAGSITSGALFSFVFYTILVATSMGSLSEVYGDWQRAIGALERIIDISKAKSEIKNPINPVKIIGNPDIFFSDVTFFYPTRPDVKILSGVTFNINYGTFTAIVGHSGSGKSSILQLILRLYDINHGSICVSGIDLRKIALSDLRSYFTYVSQDPVIFSGSFYENISYSKPDATFKQVLEAAKKAEIYDFIDSLPNKFSTFIGEKGVEISGGQKQRIAIARAFLINPSILLLDEATNALDLENEQAIYKALKNERCGKTTIIVSHRLYSVIDADQIIVISEGRVNGHGKHKDLLSSNNLYQKLYKEA